MWSSDEDFNSINVNSLNIFKHTNKIAFQIRTVFRALNKFHLTANKLIVTQIYWNNVCCALTLSYGIVISCLISTFLIK